MENLAFLFYHEQTELQKYLILQTISLHVVKKFFIIAYKYHPNALFF